MKFKDILARLALITATVIWGSAFVVMKNTLDVMPTAWLLTVRFTGAAAVLSLFFFRRLRQVDRDLLKKGALTGLFLFLGYYVQTLGLNLTTPGKNSFLTSVYCIIVPFMAWAVYRTRPDKNSVAAAFICIAGVGFVSLTEKLTIGLGDLLAIFCGFFYAAQILCLDRFTRERDPILITIISFVTSAILSFVVAVLTEPFPKEPLSASAIVSLVYLCIFSTAIAMLLQALGQKGTPTATASIILALEAVFGVVFSLIFYHEAISLRMYLGFALIFAAVLICELRPLDRLPGTLGRLKLNVLLRLKD